jgi:hypothetical protein
VQRAKPVDGFAFAIDGAAQKDFANGQHAGLAHRAHPRTGAQQNRIAQQHHQRPPIAKTDDFGA